MIARRAVSKQPTIFSFLNANVVRRAGIVALILGAALTLANQSGAVFGSGKVQLFPLVLVYATPFIVVAVSQILGIRRAHLDALGVQALSREKSITTAVSHAIPLRSVAMGLIVGSVNTSIVVFAALMENYHDQAQDSHHRGHGPNQRRRRSPTAGTRISRTRICAPQGRSRNGVGSCQCRVICWRYV